jgi:hypothetical protein
MGKLRRNERAAHVRAEDCNGVAALAYDFADQALDFTSLTSSKARRAVSLQIRQDIRVFRFNPQTRSETLRVKRPRA